MWTNMLKLWSSELPSRCETEQPLMAQKHKPKTITIEPRKNPEKWEHINKT